MFLSTQICIKVFESGHIRVKNLGEKKYIVGSYCLSIAGVLKCLYFSGNFARITFSSVIVLLYIYHVVILRNILMAKFVLFRCH